MVNSKINLRLGTLVIGYLGILTEIVDISMLIYYGFLKCSYILTLWIIASIWNVSSELFLLVAVYRNNPHLLPVHLVTCLGGLIMMMITHMLVATSGVLHYGLVGYALFSIGFMFADVLIVLSFYHSEK
ncbi:uncharacterized protein Dana_GF27304 [Drosophila ananassae]|uniref:MARVEL domain-containing protein n=1 Tax=Drosophila ananassae TaxID=7217 RepID=A0A0P8XFA2_DROAN|nr:uncharacterized protein Dana_GF27304 [Drosophila ananassae]